MAEDLTAIRLAGAHDTDPPERLKGSTQEDPVHARRAKQHILACLFLAALSW
jgi:hypothetical protein